MKNGLKKYDVVLVDFGNNAIGSEQGGKRPAIIIQNDIGNNFSPTTIVIPFSSKLKNPRQPTHSLFKKDKGKGLEKDSILLGECMRQISERRIIKYLGSISDKSDISEVKRVYFANFGE